VEPRQWISEPLKLRSKYKLALNGHRRPGVPWPGGIQRLGPDQPARIWPGPGWSVFGPDARRALLVLLISAAGCGGATAPCPTPTTELDQLRDRSERLEQDLARATREDRKVSAQREEAGRRIAAAQAALDSIARAKGR